MRLSRRPPSQAPRRVRVGAAVVLGSCLIACGCASLPFGSGKRTVTLVLTSTADLNNCGKSSALPLSYRVIQVTDPGPLAGMKPERIWGKEAAMLGGGLVWLGPESVIEAGTTKQDNSIPLDPTAKAVVVIANYCKTRESCFYHVEQVTGKKRLEIRLTADATCLTPSPR